MEKFFKKFPSVCVAFAGIMWGIISIFVRRLGDEGFSSLDIMLVRSVIAMAGIFLYLIIFDREKLKIDIRDWWIFFGTGVLSFFTFGAAYFMTIESTSVSVAAVLLYTSPVFVMIMAAIFFKEKITAVKVLATCIAVIGCVFVSGGFGGESVSPSGLATGILSGFCYALYSIFGRIAAKKYSPITVTAYTFLFASVACLFTADTGGIIASVCEKTSLLPFMTAMAVVTAIFPYILYTGGLKYTSAGKAAVMACVEPAVAFLTGVIVFSERLTVQSVLGAAMILAAIIILNKNPANKN